MKNVSKIIKWMNGSKVLDCFSFSCNENEELRVKTYIIDALTNKPNPILQKDWSEFGKNGDCIIVENVTGGEEDGII